MGAGNEVAVQLHKLDDVVSALGAFNSDVTAQLDQLEQRIAQLHLQWAGSAAVAYQQAHAEWSEGARMMAESVQRMQSAAAATARRIRRSGALEPGDVLLSGEPLRVSSGDLVAAAQFADGVADQLADRYAQAAAAVAALTSGEWKGSAAEACAAAWQEWSDGFRMVVMGLRDEVTAMQLAASQYASTDGYSASTIAGT